jgi:CheY-like chemotaxis protein
MVLVVSDPATCPNVARTLASAYAVEHARSLEQAVVRLRSGTAIDVVVSERYLPDGTSGLALLAEVVRAAPPLLRVLVAGSDIDSELDTAVADGLVDWVVERPWTPATLLQPVRHTRRFR